VWPTADVVPLLNLFLNALALALPDLRRRADGEARKEVESIRQALFRLEDLLASWLEQAKETNEVARGWASGLPESARGAALVHLYDSGLQQAAYARDLFGHLMLGIPPKLRRDGAGSLDQLLRIHAPEFFDRLVLLDERKQQIDTIGDELERSYREGGEEAVERYLGELDRSLAGLEQAHRRLAAFIADTFPLGATSA
jgi:hypothetical protein